MGMEKHFSMNIDIKNDENNNKEANEIYKNIN